MDDLDVMSAIDASELNDHLPIGVLVVDDTGAIRHANRRVQALTGYARDELVGRSITQFVDEHDLVFIASSVEAAAAYDGQVMGPARLRYRHRDGTVRWTEYWAYECPDTWGFNGWIATLSTESVSDGLAEAAVQIASDRPLDDNLAAVANAVSGYPLVAVGSILRSREGRLRSAGRWPFTGDLFVDDVDMPWYRVQFTEEAFDTSVDDLPAPARELAAEYGFKSVWIRPIGSRGSSAAGVFVGWRHEALGASPNQERHLAEVLGVARLAIDHDDHRAELERAALFDHLTGLGNRAMLAQRLTDDERGVAVLYVDLDRFKLVNDTYGHDVGDLVLSAAARRLRSVVRDNDTVFRIGGDEFVVLCSGIGKNEDRLSEIATRIVTALQRPFQIGSVTVSTGASVGVASREPSDSISEVIRRADQALLKAKRDGRARWERSVAPDDDGGDSTRS